MAATKFTLTQTPTKILDGTRSAYIQEIRGKNTLFTTAVTAPDPLTVPACQILKNDLAIAVGFPLWAWTPTAEPIEIVVLEEV
jgi:hypothetical protein